MQNWDELKTAFYVAKHGTASGAAAALGVHHATVIRQVDALEARLGVKLFQRHGRGFAPTEAGLDVLDSIGDVDAKVAQLETRLKTRTDSVDGDLVVTALPILSPLLMPILAQFQADHPGVRITLRSETRVQQIERGDAHVALRAGRKPDMEDYVVQSLGKLQFAAYAKAPHGFENLDQASAQVGVIGFADTSPGPNNGWIETHVPADRIRFRVATEFDLLPAALAGLGVVILPRVVADGTPGLHPVDAPAADWAPDLWLVTHVDLHRTAKIKAITERLKTVLP